MDTWADGDDLTGAIAKNLLYINFGEEFYLPPVDLGEGAKRVLGTGFGSEQVFKASVYPNPADDYVSFQFSGTMGIDIVLSIVDQKGREIQRLEVNGKRPLISIATKDFISGQYFYQATTEFGEHTSGKFTVVR